MTEPITTLVVFTFPAAGRLRAFLAMARVPTLLRDLPGLRFHKMMGTGRGRGFSLLPDWSRYAFLGVWETPEQAEAFLADSPFIRYYRRHAAHVTTLLLRTIGSHGLWDGSNPFAIPSDEHSYEHSGATETTGEVAILTRASIRLARLRAFWRRVAPVDRELGDAAGLRWSIGMGEMPWIQQATFSIWDDLESMKAFAYGSAHHRDVIRRTRQEKWYAEELFARFVVIERRP